MGNLTVALFYYLQTLLKYCDKKAGADNLQPHHYHEHLAVVQGAQNADRVIPDNRSPYPLVASQGSKAFWQEKIPNVKQLKIPGVPASTFPGLGYALG